MGRTDANPPPSPENGESEVCGQGNPDSSLQIGSPNPTQPAADEARPANSAAGSDAVQLTLASRHRGATRTKSRCAKAPARPSVTELQVGERQYELSRGRDRGFLMELRVPACPGGLVLNLRFKDAQTFDRWCDRNAARLLHPQQHARLRREGHEILARDT